MQFIDPVNNEKLVTRKLNMKYSKSHLWFANVRWDERNCYIDCLVDITKCDKNGHILVDDRGELKIYSYDKFLGLQDHTLLMIIGNAIRWNYDLFE